MTLYLIFFFFFSRQPNRPIKKIIMVLVLGKMKGLKTHLSLLHLQDSGKVNGRKQIEMTKSQTLPTHQIIYVFLLLVYPWCRFEP